MKKQLQTCPSGPTQEPTTTQPSTPTTFHTTAAPTPNPVSSDKNVSNVSICVWGATPGNVQLNGEYKYVGVIEESNNLPYYELNVDSTCDIRGVSTFYLYNYQNQYWFIGSTVGSTNTFALCESTSNNPIDCHNNHNSY